MTINKAMMFAAALTIIVSVFGLAVETSYLTKVTNFMITVQWSAILFVCVMQHIKEKEELVASHYLDLINDETAVPRESIPDAMRAYVFRRDDFTCSYCHQQGTAAFDPDGRAWNCDHVIPVAKGGKTHPSNLTTACSSCNLSKGAKTPVQFMRYRQRQGRWKRHRHP